MTDSEKLDYIQRSIKRNERMQALQTLVVVLGFIGIISLGTLIDKAKKFANGK